VSDHDKITQFGLMGQCSAGSSFGELALLHHAPRQETVTCVQDATVWINDRIVIKSILYDAHKSRMMDYVNVLESVELFNCLLVDEKQALAENFYEKHFIKGEHLMHEGEEGTVFFVLLEGQVSFMRNNQVTRTIDAKSSKGQFFGERAILKKEPRLEGCVAVSDDVVVAMLGKHEFELLLGPLEELMLVGPNRGSKLPTPAAPLDSSLVDIKMTQLRRIGLLGCGGFGAVSLEQHTQTGKCYALKQLSKGHIMKTKMQKSVISEKRILMLCDSKFVIKLYTTFKTKDSLYFLMEPAMGGELYATYHKYRFHGSPTKAKFYTASVVYAFDHLHEKHVLYRDLKPENLLLDNFGFCKLTDMGLAKQTVTKTYTTCGTPDYFAPEVIQQQGQNCGVDWWTCGVLIHELMSGHAPFEASNPTQIYKKVILGVSHVNFPYKNNDPAAVEIVKALLVKNPNERLPMLPGGINNVKHHPWFSNFNWDAMWNQQMQPPYKPQVKSMTDISNFRAKESDIPPQLPYKDPGDGWDNDF
jgi:cGMP-dependent protein kinase